MKNMIKLEEFAMFLASVFALYLLGSPWWCYLLLLAAPDIGMIGYLWGPSFGAMMYNVFHHKGIAVVIALVGLYFGDLALQLSGIIMFGHASLDRMLGFGLKHPDGFNHTHMGTIGKKNK